jgi:hypothetical protein
MTDIQKLNMTIFECQKDKNMTRVKNKVKGKGKGKGCFRVYIMTLTILPEILIPQLYNCILLRKLILRKSGSNLRSAT